LHRIGVDHRLQPVPVEPVSAWYPDYSREQRRLVYQRRTMDTEVMRIDLGERPALHSEPLITSTHEDREAKYSPDGTKIVFISTRNGEPAVWRSNADGTNQILIGAVAHGIPGSPRWTPDGQFVVFDASSQDTGSDIYIVPAEGGTPRHVTSSKAHETTPSVSRDGRWVYYVSEGIWKIPINGGAPVRVTESGGRPLESTDGQWVYFTRSGGIWRIPVSGGKEELFQPDVVSSAWALTAADLYVITQEQNLRRQLIAYDLRTRERRAILDLPPSIAFYSSTWLDVHPDGSSALLSPLVRDQSDLVVVDGFR
jgi:dipeptidyl aminopeptidase/acylaminoacyl peptidase